RRFLSQAALNDGPEGWRNVRGKGRWKLVEDRRTQFETGAAAERKLAGRSFVENDTQSPEVAAVVARLASENLRRHVLQSAGQSYTCIKGIDGGVHGSRAGVSQIPLKTPGQAEIEDLDAAFRCGDDVGAFQVAVNDATTMRVSK